MIRRIVADTILWVFFAVILGVVELWYALVIFVFSGRPLHYRVLQDGSIIAFAISLAATTFGVYYLRVERQRYPLMSAGALIAGVGIPFTGLAVYSQLVTVLTPAFNSTPSSNVLWWTIGLASGAILFSLFTNIMVNIERGRG